ncbi:MAG: hypothetical protein LBR10_10425, partial [Prevotellaceae bacterium]|nr:hypothetical protein [Prevotellaceae bacterium]
MKKNSKIKVLRKPHQTVKSTVSKTQLDKCYAVVQKLLGFMGFDPELFDMFSKKQKTQLLTTEYSVPCVHAQKGHYVPRQYIENIRRDLLDFMKTNYLDESIKLTYMDAATYGLSFLFNATLLDMQGLFQNEQKQFIEQIKDRFKNLDLLNEGGFEDVFNEMLFQVSLYSQVNFRTYGFCHKWEPYLKDTTGFRLTFELTSMENERIYFTYNGKSRIAFRLLLGQTAKYEASTAVIRKSKLFPDAKSDRKYNIYIQSHVIHRFKERIDIMEATNRNHILHVSLTSYQCVVQGAGGRLLLMCSVHDTPLGYFPFTIQNDNLFILSFLPLVSNITPEGNKLYKLLKLCKED